MPTPIYTNNHRRNLVNYWRQFYPDWTIPEGYHVHHIKPRCLFDDPNDPRIHHPRNLIALHPDDHVSIHKCRGDKFVNNWFIIQSYNLPAKRKANIDENGLNCYQRSSKKGVETARNNIDEDGNNSYQREVLRQRNTIDENGVSLLELSSRKAIDTMRNTIDENGENGIDRSRDKMVETMKSNDGFSKARKKQIDTMKNDVDESGLSALDRASIKRQETIKINRIKKYPELHDKEYFKNFIDKDGEIQYNKCKEFFDISLDTLRKIRKYHNL